MLRKRYDQCQGKASFRVVVTIVGVTFRLTVIVGNVLDLALGLCFELWSALGLL